MNPAINCKQRQRSKIIPESAKTEKKNYSYHNKIGAKLNIEANISKDLARASCTNTIGPSCSTGSNSCIYVTTSPNWPCPTIQNARTRSMSPGQQNAARQSTRRPNSFDRSICDKFNNNKQGPSESGQFINKQGPSQ